jgi:hypothetical protein
VKLHHRVRVTDQQVNDWKQKRLSEIFVGGSKKCHF